MNGKRYESPAEAQFEETPQRDYLWEGYGLFIAFDNSWCKAMDEGKTLPYGPKRSV